MLLRSASVEDATGIHALLSAIYAEGGAFVNDHAESLAALRARIAARDPARSLYLLAVNSGGEPVGWCELHRFSASRLRHVAVLTLAVARRARRRGVARALLALSYDWCQAVGVVKMSLNVRASNRAAITLYRSEGFVLEGRERFQLRLAPGEGEGFEDNLIMARWVGAGSPPAPPSEWG